MKAVMFRWDTRMHVIPFLVSATSLFALPNNEVLASRLLTTTRAIDVGTTPQVEAEKMLLPYTSIEWYDKRDDSGRALTRVSFHIDNEQSRAFTKTPYTMIDFSLTFDKSIVVEKVVTIYVSSGYAAEVLERKRGFGFRNGVVSSADRSRYVDHNWQSDLHMGRIDVIDDSSLALKTRQADWHVNVHCLSLQGGCTDARQLISLNQSDLAEPKDIPKTD